MEATRAEGLSWHPRDPFLRGLALRPETLNPMTHFPNTARLLATMLFLAGIARAAEHTAPHGDAGTSQPDAIVEQISGVAQVRSNGRIYPAGPLTLLFVGDTIVVHSGSAHVRHMRLGTIVAVSAGHSYGVTPSSGPSSEIPSRLQTLAHFFANQPDREWRIGGARAYDADLGWPHQVSLAPEVPHIFNWWRCPGAIAIHISSSPSDTLRIGIAEQDRPLPWPAAIAPTPGTYTWSVVDSSGTHLWTGTFTILATQCADSLRRVYLSRASLRYTSDVAVLAANLIAASDGYYLW